MGRKLRIAVIGGGIGGLTAAQLFWRDTSAAAAHRGLMRDWQSEGWVRASLVLPMPALT